MAGYSENREHNLEVKYLRKVLGEVDDRIALPEGLRGDALLGLLEGVEQQAPPMSATLVKPRKWLNMRSGLAYAAAFVLIVGLFFGLGINRQDNLVDGSITLEPRTSPAALPQLDQTQISDTLPESDTAAADSGPATGGGAAQEETFQARMETFQMQENPDAGGDGIRASAPEALGGIVSTQLGAFGDYRLVSRPADENDPDLSSDNVLELLDPEENRLVALIQLPAMTRVHSAFSGEELVTVVGSDDEAVYALILDLSNPEEPRTVTLLEQPGSLSGARLYEDVVQVVSYSGAPAGDSLEVVELPDSAESGAAIFTAVSLADGDHRQVAFQGAGDEIKLYNINAYVYYDSAAQGADDSDYFIAQINLPGLEIELAGVS